ncbi:TIGR04282 family arsenosugar biosynthesis glycosyltransferase [Azorhizophilus paspali]|uniref:TIGR04282 family arsenosugar biosynthesis glycosyltransferase n=1 Tax=Azorhizophilus paspali TaxID=69963 RepID=A0ABV6SF73_AZOPA
MSLSISLHLLAHAPAPGQVKPRLISALGEDGACDLQRLLVERALHLPVDGFQDRFLWLDEGPDEALGAMAEACGWAVVEQPAGDLGERMRRIATLGLCATDAVILIGNDSPALDGDYLQAACEALRERDVVLGPAEHGDYALLGLRRLDPSLFEAIPWGCEDVLPITCERLRRLGWKHCLLPCLWGVEGPEDLLRLSEVGICLR